MEGGSAGVDIGAKLGALLEQLTQIQSSFSQQSNILSEEGQDRKNNNNSSNNHKALLDSIKVKLAETELLVLGTNARGDSCEQSVRTALTSRGTDIGAVGVSPEPDVEKANARSNLMRYSTPNLILSSNFEHILRQQDRVSFSRQASVQAGRRIREGYFLT